MMEQYTSGSHADHVVVKDALVNDIRILLYEHGGVDPMSSSNGLGGFKGLSGGESAGSGTFLAPALRAIDEEMNVAGFGGQPSVIGSAFIAVLVAGRQRIMVCEACWIRKHGGQDATGVIGFD